MTKEKMTREKKKPSRLAKALDETARDMRRGELLDEAAYAKITMRHLGENEVPKADPITGEEIRALREKAHLSQAVFARHLAARTLRHDRLAAVGSVGQALMSLAWAMPARYTPARQYRSP